MHIKKLKNTPEIIAGDNTILRELFHPDRDYEFNSRYSLAHAIVKTGQTTKKHRLKTNEIYYILNGTGLMHIDSESEEVTSGDVIDIPANAAQSISNIGSEDLEFLCIVDPAWQPEDEEILE